MSGDDGNNKNPQEQLQELIKSGVNAANSGLRTAQSAYLNVKEPVSSAFQSAEEHGSVALDAAKLLYVKRKQHAPELVGGTAALTGGYLWLRRGRIAGVFGAAISAGAAYSVVYDEFSIVELSAAALPNSLEKALPSINNIFGGKKDE
uniref:MICOS complex subunit n=1 Tax=Pseudo-nitzschia australis TaxID=44445 RepID=A0A6V0CEG6_9STRA|eukprot:CAMPEP_0168203984 /NCGR_PEP_ID=MMETSP0139_2-20121125/25155_1 /TAXON_ID=44445 /ORGANISM="Pseudo-nitzschia australis, Strain 10249 10 AB" /LENGTH=147 /DNA_ID=CAMNT_0008129891 /DNA_START=184 /DNA_END=627 /DNA_ORIENTATION=-